MADKFQNKYRIPSARLQNWDYGSNGAYFITICTQNSEHFFGEIRNGEMQLNEIGQLAEKYWLEIPIHFQFIELGNFVIMPNHTHGILIINKNESIDNDPAAINDDPAVQTPNLGVSDNDDPTVQTPNLGVSGNDDDPAAQPPNLGVSCNDDDSTVQPPNLGVSDNDDDPAAQPPNLGVSDNDDDPTVQTPNLGVSDIKTPNLGVSAIKTPNLGVSDIQTPRLGVSTDAKKNGGKNEKWKPNTIGSIINQYKRIVTINARQIHADFGWQPRFHDHIIRNAQSFENIQNYIANNPLNWNKDKFYGNN